MISAVAARYAKALVEVVTEPGSPLDPQQALTELQAVSAVMQSSAELRAALLSPAVSPARKRAVVARLTGPLGIHEKIRNFLYVVINHRRVHEFALIVEAFGVLLDERLGYVRASVSSARPLTEEQRARIEPELARLAGKR